MDETHTHAERVKQIEILFYLTQLTEDTEFQEFVAVHNSHSTKSLWSNDATVCDQVKEVKLSKGKRSRNSEMKPDTGISTKGQHF